MYRLSPADGRLSLVQILGNLENPSFLTLNRAQDRLYTVHGDSDQVSAFSIDALTGEISLLSTATCGGRNPVDIVVDPSGKFVVVSDHLGSGDGGALKVMPLMENGAIGPVIQSVQLEGEPGPYKREQPFAKPHFNPFDRSGRYVAVPDKGVDRIFVFRFDGGVLTPAHVPWVGTREGAGPRHMVFHPSNAFAYVVNELDSTVASYRFDEANGRLEPFQIVSTLPDTFVGNSKAAEIQISKDGRELYASNRGCDSIARFKVDAKSGRIDFQGVTSSGGRTPRYFALGPDERFLYALNEDSDSIVTFRLDRGSEPALAQLDVNRCGSPVCMVFKSV